MDTNLSRRSVVRGSVWGIPAVMVATTAPAFAAASGVPTCTGAGWYKDPGKGQHTKDYYVQLDCTYDGDISSVKIYDDVDKVWREATLVSGDIWKAVGFNDSRRTRKVLINGTTTIVVSFSPSN